MADEKNPRLKVAQKGFSGKHFLEVSCYIEFIKMEKYTRLDDLIFIELSPNYDRTKSIKMRLGTIDLRSIAYGLKEILRGSIEVGYKKYTDPKLAGGSGSKNELNIRKQDHGFYINFFNGSTPVGFTMDKYTTASMADSFNLMAEETEKAIYYHQRNPGKGQAAL